MMKIPAIELIDFYDYDKLEKLQETRARKWLKLYLNAKNGDKKAIKDIQKHEEEEREIKNRARQSGYHWV